MLEHAIMYARRGWRVHPLRPGRKDPATHAGCRDATTDAHRLTAYWARRPTANIGIATGEASGLWVLDVDGPDAARELRALFAEHGHADGRIETFTTRTGRDGGGWQLFWAWPSDMPEGWRILNSAGRIAPGLDVRGTGGYVVAPPSLHPSGRRYQVVRDLPLAEAPVWLTQLAATSPLAALEARPVEAPRARLAREERRARALHAACLRSAPERIAHAPEHTRNIVYHGEVFGLARARVPRAEAEPVLKNAAIAAGLTPREIAKSFESGWAAGSRAAPLAERGARR